ncbi:MAG: hypothetical protein OEZ11_07800 [Gammaproteobacteria bacterium]|nr:hypothetical protein [Gammaproteobacteria bacterium]
MGIDYNTSTLSSSYKSPLTVRVFDSLPGNPVSIGIALAIVLLVVFLAGRALFGAAENSSTDDLRVAITQILITAYSGSAYAYLLMTARKSTRDLSAVARDLPNWSTIISRAGKHPWWILLLVGAANYLVIGVAVTNATTPEPVNPWEWQTWNYDVFWHRITTVVFVWWMACFSYVTVVESARLSRVSADIPSLDILDMRPYKPLIRQGLTNALLVFGMVSVLSLLAVESRYYLALLGFWIAFTVLAWIGLMLPLRGIRKKIKAARNQELDWCRQHMVMSRDALKSGENVKQSIAEVTAYRTLIEKTGNWPFDSLTLVRFTLYLLIPLVSWLGGAFVERGLDFILS